MVQLNFFSNDAKKTEKKESPKVIPFEIYTDGASRKNPGPSGIGFYMKQGDNIIFEQGFFVGKKTNNQAEYLALVAALFFSRKFLKSSDKLSIFLDSQLVVRQMNKQYKVKDLELKRLQQKAYDLLKGFSYSFDHIYRDKNTVADRLANRGIDKKVPMPKKLSDYLNI